MASELALSFKAQLSDIHSALLAVPSEMAEVPWRSGGWTRKQIVGHLLDSAANNRQRFVRAAIDGEYTGPFYEQDAWVAAHGYGEQNWSDLLRWWLAEHELLMAGVDRIPESRFASLCRVGDNDPVTLRFLIEDYLRHQKHHLAQITSAA